MNDFNSPMINWCWWWWWVPSMSRAYKRDRNEFKNEIRQLNDLKLTWFRKN